MENPQKLSYHRWIQAAISCIGKCEHMSMQNNYAFWLKVIFQKHGLTLISFNPTKTYQVSNQWIFDDDSTDTFRLQLTCLETELNALKQNLDIFYAQVLRSKLTLFYAYHTFTESSVTKKSMESSTAKCLGIINKKKREKRAKKQWP